MNVCIVRFTDHVNEPASDGWRVSVELPNLLGHEAAGTEISIPYPFNNNVEEHIRWYLETFPVDTPWEVGRSSKIQQFVVDYATVIFSHIPLLHDIGTAENCDSIVIDIVDTGHTSSNIFELHWEALENPVVWDELWALMYPPKALHKPKAIPHVTVRRTVYVVDRSFDKWGMGSFDLDDPSDSDNGNVESSFKQVHESNERREIIKGQAVQYNEFRSAIQVHQTMAVSLRFFRILLVVARSIDTEKSRRPPSAGDRPMMFDIDPSLISEPLLEAIAGLPKSLDVRLELCRPGSWDVLERTLQEKGRGYYDLVHFDMHGTVHKTKGAGLDFLSSVTKSKHPDFGKTDFVSATKIGALLSAAGIVMVALNACRTAREEPPRTAESGGGRNPNGPQHEPSTEDVAPTSEVQTNLAKVFVKSGVPCVLAMSYDVIPSFVAIFYQSFYKALLQSKSDVAEAVTTARKALLSKKERAVGYGLSVELADWIIPVLYQSHDVTFSLQSPNAADSDPLPIQKTIEKASSSDKSLRQLFARTSMGGKFRSPIKQKSTARKVTDRMHGRGLEILYVEALLLNINSHRTLCLSGEPGIGKTHFVKGLADHWLRTGCISNEALYIDCSPHTNWKGKDVLKEIVQRAMDVDYSAELVEQTQQILKSEKRLVILDGVKAKNLSLSLAERKTKPNLESFIQSLHGGQSRLIIVSRADLQDHPRWLSEKLGEKPTEFIEFWSLSDRNQLAIQEMTLDILRQLGRKPRLGSKYETRDLGRVLQCLEHNPLTISLFLQTMSAANLLPNMKDALHHILFGAIRLPLAGPHSSMVCVAHKVYTDLSSMANGQDLQQLALCLCFFNNVIPCSLNDKVFFPSATYFLAYLRAHAALPWPTAADPSIVKQGAGISRNPLEYRAQLKELSKDSEPLFCVLVEHFLGAGLLEFTRSDQQDELTGKAIDQWRCGIVIMRVLLSNLRYIRISPVLTHCLRGLAAAQASTKGEIVSQPHGIDILKVQEAYCAYMSRFSKSSMEKHDSCYPNVNPRPSTTNDEGVISASDIVYYHDAPNFYSAIYTAMRMQRWGLLPAWALNDLASKGMRTFNPHAKYEPLRTGAFTEETILSLLNLVVMCYKNGSQVVRDSYVAVTYAAICSNAECNLLYYVGGSNFSDIDVYRRDIQRRISRARRIMRKSRVLDDGPRAPLDSDELYLQELSNMIDSQTADEKKFKRLVGDDRYRHYEGERREDSLFATAYKGGARGE